VEDALARVDGWIAAHRGHLLQTLGDLVEFATPSPPGRNTGRAQDFIAARLARLGAVIDRFDVYPGDPDVVGTVRGAGGGRSLLLSGHIDVAEVGDSGGWTRPPFRLSVEG
jgi:acetylornithine deacetylase/succinyl-diaminopimelate desuccinylase-like protein